jgi:hypothetical protein
VNCVESCVEIREKETSHYLSFFLTASPHFPWPVLPLWGWTELVIEKLEEVWHTWSLRIASFDSAIDFGAVKGRSTFDD